MSESEIALLKSLKTLQYNVDFPKPFTDYIFNKSNISCDHLHSGEKCLHYWIKKAAHQVKVAGKIQVVACLIPALVFSIKHLHKDTWSKLKEMLIKWAKATFYVAFAGTAPWIMICLFSKFKMLKPGYYWPQTIAYSIAMLGIFVEPLPKHS